MVVTIYSNGLLTYFLLRFNAFEVLACLYQQWKGTTCDGTINKLKTETQYNPLLLVTVVNDSSLYVLQLE